MTPDRVQSRLSPEKLAELLTMDPETKTVLSIRPTGQEDYYYMRPSGGPTLVKPGSETKPIETWPHRPNSGA